MLKQFAARRAFILSLSVVASEASTSELSLSLVQRSARHKIGTREFVNRGNCAKVDPPPNPWWEPPSYTVVIPSAKLAFCSIPKVASTDFNRMFVEANGLNTSMCTSMCENHASQTGAAALGVNPSDITNQNGWTFAYFVRDPLSRYLSSYGSKCLPHDDGVIGDNGTNCCGDVSWDTKDTSEYVKDFETRALSDLQNGISVANEHWAPQENIVSKACKEFSGQHVDYIGTLSGDINSKVKDMLKMSHVNKFNELADKYFPPQGEVWTHHSSKSTVNFDTFYNNPDVVAAVAKLYESDYAAFPLDRPKV